MRRDSRNPVLPTVAWVCNVAFLALIGWYLLGYFQTLDGLIEQATGNVIGRDFVVFWSAATLTTGGNLAELYDPEAFQAALGSLFSYEPPYYTWTHPPHMLLLVIPLAAVPYLWSLAAWSLVGLAAYMVVVRKPALLCAPATFTTLLLGQTGLLIGAVYLGALALLRRRPILSGICIGLIAVKPHLGVLIPVALVAAHAWCTFVSAALTVLALVTLSALTFGWEAWRAWLFDALPHQATFLAGFEGAILVSAFSGARIAGLPVWGAWLVQVPFTLIAVVATWWAFSGLRRGLVDETSAFAVLLLATVIATPYLYAYDLTLVSPVALYAMAAWRQRAERLRDLGEIAVWVAVWMLPVLGMMVGSGVVPFGSLALLAALLITLRRAYGRSPFGVPA